jgi:uncharacterized membrane protein
MTQVKPLAKQRDADHKVLAQSQQWSGPLPPPAALQHFNEIIPNGAERIMKMVEEEQAHRVSYESALLAATIGDTKRGHWMGWSISIISVVGALASIFMQANPIVSVALVGVPLVSIVHAIMKSKSNSKS